MNPPPCLETDIRPAWPFQLEVKAHQETNESRLGPNRIEAWIARQVDERRVALLARLFEQRERLVHLPEPDVRQRKMVGRHESLGAQTIERLEDGPRDAALAARRLPVSQPREEHRVGRQIRSGCFQLGDTFSGAS